MSILIIEAEGAGVGLFLKSVKWRARVGELAVNNDTQKTW